MFKANETHWPEVLAIVGSNIALIIVMFGITVTMWIHMDNKLDHSIEGIRMEMRDFHTRLIQIEERGRGK